MKPQMEYLMNSDCSMNFYAWIMVPVNISWRHGSSDALAHYQSEGAMYSSGPQTVSRLILEMLAVLLYMMFCRKLIVEGSWVTSYNRTNVLANNFDCKKSFHCFPEPFTLSSKPYRQRCIVHVIYFGVNVDFITIHKNVSAIQFLIIFMQSSVKI